MCGIFCSATVLATTWKQARGIMRMKNKNLHICAFYTKNVPMLLTHCAESDISQIERRFRTTKHYIALTITIFIFLWLLAFEHSEYNENEVAAS